MEYEVYNANYSHSFGTYEAGAPVGAVCNFLQDEGYQAVLGPDLSKVLVADANASGDFYVEAEDGDPVRVEAKVDEIFQRI